MFSNLNILLMNNKHSKLSVIEQSKGCKFTPKMYQNTLAAWIRYTPLAAMGGYF